MKQRLGIAWFLTALCVGLFALLAALMLKPIYYDAARTAFGLPSFEARFVETSKSVDQWRGGFLDGKDVFLGDSIVQGLASSQVSPSSENLGIAFAGINDVVGIVRAAGLQNVRSVTVSVGINDLRRGMSADALASEYETLISTFRVGVPVTISGVMPYFSDSVNRQILALNRHLQIACAKRSACRYVDTWPRFSSGGVQRAELFLPDRLHPSPAGYREWIALLSAR